MSPIVPREKRRFAIAGGALGALALSAFVVVRMAGARGGVAPGHVGEASEPATTTTLSSGEHAGPRPVSSGAPSGSAAAAAPGADPVAALRAGLASDDESVRIAAIEAAVSTTATSTLGDLERFDLVKDPEAAPTVIHAVALLGASADGKERDVAAGTLDRWLRDESRRDTADAVGNVSNLVEAIGDVGGSDAARALGAALDRGDLPLHVQTLAVQKLGELADASARGPVERFGKRVAALPATDGFDEELRVEAIQAAQTTLARL
ncbi:MAG: hypothetical protein JWP97_5587 [Labilithrix sp.]|nr:hypothetical protein [Labilithrix sp.]